MTYPKLRHGPTRDKLAAIGREARRQGATPTEARGAIAIKAAQVASEAQRYPQRLAYVSRVRTEPTRQYREAVEHGTTAPTPAQEIEHTSSLIASGHGNCNARTWRPRVWRRRSGLKACHAITKRTTWNNHGHGRTW